MKPVIIGIDGGATKVAGCILERLNENTFIKGSDIVAINYIDCPSYVKDFKPLPIVEQLADLHSGDFSLSQKEKEHGTAYIEACEQVITSLLSQINGERPVIGIGLPGIKTPNGQGIQSMNNGPRIPNFLERLNRRLRENQINNKPFNKIGNDNDFCGIGETYAKDGAFRESKYGLYIGGGTGIADAIILNGNPVPLNSVNHWFPKTWEIAGQNGLPMESLISHRGLMDQYGKNTHSTYEELAEKDLYPETFLTQSSIGEKMAEDFSRTLSSLILDRIHTLYGGWQGTFDLLDPARLIETEFPEKGQFFDKIVFGQRLGYLLGKNPGLFKEVKKRIRLGIEASALLSRKAIDHYLSSEIILLSHLRNASVLGAGIDAYFHDKP